MNTTAMNAALTLYEMYVSVCVLLLIVGAIALVVYMFWDGK